MPTITEDQLDEAFRFAQTYPDDPQVQEKANRVKEAYNAQKSQGQESLRAMYQDRERHGWDDETYNEVEGALSDQPDLKFEVINEKYFAETYGLPKDRVRAMRKELLEAYSTKVWGEPVTDDRAFYERMGEEMDREDEVFRKGSELALKGASGFEADAAFDFEFGADPKLKARAETLRQQFRQAFDGTKDQISRLGVSVDDYATELQKSMGVGEDTGGDVMPDSWFVETVLNMPADRRDTFLAAVAARAGDGEDKSLLRAAAERLGRQATTMVRGMRNLERINLLSTLRNSVASGRITSDQIPEEYGFDPKEPLAIAFDPAKGATALQSAPKQGTPEFEALSEDQKAAITRIDKELDYITLYEQINALAEERIDPAKGSNWFNSGVIGVAGMAPNIALMAAGPIGAILNVGAYGGQATTDYLLENPGADPSDAFRIGMTTGIAQGLLDKIPTKIIQGRIPFFSKWLEKATLTRGGLIGRGAVRLGAGTLVQVGQEFSQDVLAPGVVEEIAQVLKKDLPDANWDKRLEAFTSAETMSELIPSIVMLSLIGTGVGGINDYQGGWMLAGNRRLLIGAGIEPEAADAIVAAAKAQDASTTQTLLRDAFTKLDAGPVSKVLPKAQVAALESLKKEIEDKRMAVFRLEKSGVIPQVVRSAEGFEVANKDGVTRSFATRQEAETARWEYVAEQGLEIHEDLAAVIDRMDRGIRPDARKERQLDPQVRTVLDAEREGQRTAEQSRSRIAKAEQLDDQGAPQQQAEPNAETDLDIDAEYQEAVDSAILSTLDEDDRKAAMLIVGESSTVFRDRVAYTTTKLRNRATWATVIEEDSEGDAKAFIHDGLREWLADKLFAFDTEFQQGRTINGKKLSLFTDGTTRETATDEDLIEAYSHLTQYYFVGTMKKGRADGFKASEGFRSRYAKAVREGLSPIFDPLARLYRSIALRATRLEKMRREGRLDAELERELARSVGMTEQVEYEQQVTEEATRIREEIDPGGNLDSRTTIVEEGDGFQRTVMPDGAVIEGPATFSVMQQEQDADPYKDRTGEQAGEPLTQTEISEGIEDESGTVADIEIDDDAFSDESVTTFSVVRTAPIITRASLKGKKKFVYFSDWTRVGTYTGLHNGSGISIPLQGGPMYPYIKKNAKAGAGWAFTTEGMFTRLQKRVDATDGIGLTTLYGKDNLRANPTFLAAYVEELRYALRAGLIAEDAMLANLNDARSQVLSLSQSRKDKKTGAVKVKYTVSRESEAFPFFSEPWGSIDDFRVAMESATFEVRAAMFSTTPKIVTKNKVKTKVPGQFSGSRLASQKNVKAGMPDVVAMIDLFADPQFDGGEYGLIIGAVQFEKSQSKPSRAEDIKADPHRSYPVVIKGKGIGLFDNPIYVTDVIKKKGKKPHEITRSAETGMAGVTFSVIQKQASLRLKMTRQQIIEAVEGSSDWKDFYTRHENLMREYFGPDADLFQRILSATSQAASVKANVALALKAYGQIRRGEPFKGFLPAVIGNLERIREGVEKLSGRKIGNYEDASAGDTSKVVVDRHVARMLFGVISPSAKQFAKAEKVLTEIAKLIGWEPRQVQAAIWAASIRKSGNEPASYDDYLERLNREGTLERRIGSPLPRDGGDPVTKSGRGLDAGEGDSDGSRESGTDEDGGNSDVTFSVLGGGGRTGDGSRRGSTGADPASASRPLDGAPQVEGASGPDLRLVDVARSYAKSIGLPYGRQKTYAKVNKERAARIAQAYEEMRHAPDDPVVAEAYENLIQQTVAQYRALESAGYRFWLFDSSNDPYNSDPWEAMRDLRANQSMGVFATEAGFGSGATDLDTSNNPLMADTGIRWPYGSPDGPPKRVLANDLFRAVHDAFGHGLEGSGFRAQGEENAWQSHVKLFTGSAVGAITSETRGQNSWLNYGPYGESNRTAKVEDTVFADQKTGLMPEWTWTEGRVEHDVESDTTFSVISNAESRIADSFNPYLRSPEKRRKILLDAQFRAREKAREFQEIILAGRTAAQLDREQATREGVIYGDLLVQYFGADTEEKVNALPPVDRKAARSEAKRQAEQWRKMQDRQQRTIPRETLIAAMRTLDAMIVALPSEIRGKIGGMVRLATLTEPGAMIAELERRAAKLDDVLEDYLRKEADKQVKRLFKVARPAKDESGKARKGKAGADIHDLFDMARRAWKGMSATDAEAHALGLEAAVATGNLTPEEEAHKLLEAELVRSFGGWEEADAERRNHALDVATDIWTRGYHDYKAKKVAEKDERDRMRADLRAATGKAGKRPDRVKAQEAGLKWTGSAKEKFFSLLNFDQLVTWIFGDTPVARWFVTEQRKAENAKIDAVQQVVDGIEDLFTSLAGGNRFEGERLQYRMMQRSITATSGTGTIEPLSELEAISALLMWMQEDGKRHMMGRRDENGNLLTEWSYDQDFIDEISGKLSREAWKVLGYLVQEYGKEYEPLNAVYREIYGINLPRHSNYSPLTVKPVLAGQGQTIDPTTGSTVSAGSFTPGSLRTRAQVSAEPDFRDAISTFLSHKKQIEHWKTHAILMREAQGVLGNRELGNSVEASSGPEAIRMLRKWLDMIAQGGNRNAAVGTALMSLYDRMVGRAASMALVGRIGTLMIQAGQLGAATAAMPTGAYLTRLSRLMTGNLGWGDAMRSEYIQRRLAQAPVAVRLAMDGLQSSKPTRVKHAIREVGKLLSGADALFTAGTFAIVLDYQKTRAMKSGMSEADATVFAMQEAERIVENLAQPTRMGTRSFLELSKTDPMAKLAWAFGSDARKNLALLGYSWAKGTPAEKARATLFVVGVNGILSGLIRNLWRDMKDDEDEEVFDEKYWSLRRLALGASTDWLFGFPIVGEEIQGAIYAAAGEYRPDSGLFSAIAQAPGAVKNLVIDFDSPDVLRDVEKIVMAAGLFNDTMAAYASILHVIRDLFGLGSNFIPDTP